MTAVRFRKCCTATSMLDLIGTEYTNQALPLPPPPTRLISPACTAGQSPGFPAMRCLHAGKVTCTALFAVRRPTPALDWPARPPRIRLAGTPEATAGEHVSCRLFFSLCSSPLLHRLGGTAETSAARLSGAGAGQGVPTSRHRAPVTPRAGACVCVPRGGAAACASAICAWMLDCRCTPLPLLCRLAAAPLLSTVGHSAPTDGHCWCPIRPGKFAICLRYPSLCGWGI